MVIINKNMHVPIVIGESGVVNKDIVKQSSKLPKDQSFHNI